MIDGSFLGKFESRSDRQNELRKKDPKKDPHKEKSLAISMIARLPKIVGGLDETRTRDPMRDRHVF